VLGTDIYGPVNDELFLGTDTRVLGQNVTGDTQLHHRDRHPPRRRQNTVWGQTPAISVWGQTPALWKNHILGDNELGTRTFWQLVGDTQTTRSQTTRWGHSRFGAVSYFSVNFWGQTPTDCGQTEAWRRGRHHCRGQTPNFSVWGCMGTDTYVFQMKNSHYPTDGRRSQCFGEIPSGKRHFGARHSGDRHPRFTWGQTFWADILGTDTRDFPATRRGPPIWQRCAAFFDVYAQHLCRPVRPFLDEMSL